MYYCACLRINDVHFLDQYMRDYLLGTQDIVGDHIRTIQIEPVREDTPKDKFEYLNYLAARYVQQYACQLEDILAPAIFRLSDLGATCFIVPKK